MLCVVLVGTEYELNLGMAARAMKNFGVPKLLLVSPKISAGFEAHKFAKHSEEVLDNAKTVSSLADAVKEFDVVVGTTAAVGRFARRLKNCISLPELRERISSTEKVALLFGPEGVGLSEGDLGECDVIVTIPASSRNPVMNLSHAVAVVLYELKGRKMARYYKAAGRKKQRIITGMFEEMVGLLPPVRNKEKVVNAFSKVLSRSRAGDNEVQAMMVAFSRIRKKLHEKAKQSC